MSTTHDTYNWDSLDNLEADALEKSREACRKRGEELDRLAERVENAKRHREYVRNMGD